MRAPATRWTPRTRPSMRSIAPRPSTLHLRAPACPPMRSRSSSPPTCTSITREASRRVRRTGGHTRFHQIVYLESGGHTAVFAADLMPTTAHIDEPWIMGYDLYPMETLAFKRHFVREAIEREYLIFFEHDPKIAAGYIR